MQLTKRFNETEKNFQRARGEVFRLKLKIEEMVANNKAPCNFSPVYSAAPTRVVEDLRFVMEDKKTIMQPEKPLRERIVLQDQFNSNAINLSIGVEEASIAEEQDHVPIVSIPSTMILDIRTISITLTK